MLGIPNMYLIAGAVLAVILSFFAGDFHGYSKEHAKFVAFQDQVKAIGEAQIKKNKQIVVDQTAITKQTADDYEAKIAKIHTAYAGAQEATVQAVTQSTKERVTNDYESKISALHRYYGDAVDRVFHAGSSGSRVPSVPATSCGVDARPADNGLAERCAVTTQEYISLREWVQKQTGVK